MCGIIGVVSKNVFDSNDALKILKKLEYRGYDSFGIATDNGFMEKHIGEITSLEKNNCTKALCHTRWATHGAITEVNAHPHTDCRKKIFIVHNGIIENYLDIKSELQKNGCCFTSNTDSEVIAHFFEQYENVIDGIRAFFKHAEGNFAIALMKKGDDNLYAFKRGSPLALGVADGMHIISSDAYAFSDITDKSIFFNENECAVVSENECKFFLLNDNVLKAQTKSITNIPKINDTSKNSYRHYMLKEIHEEPAALQRLFMSLENEQATSVKKIKDMIEHAKRVVFVASGTSYHATLLGVTFLNRVGIETHTIIASEFRNFYLVDKDTLIIPVTQSGETMDVIEALHGMKDCGARIASIVNVPYSTVQRMSNVSVNIAAGQEICVAATKTFVNQVTCLAYIASLFNKSISGKNILSAVESALQNERKIEKLALSLKNSKDIYIIGRSFLYPVSREIALKLKEISYVHAEGMMAGELKHGTLALIEKGTPVIALMHESDKDILSNAKEVEARGGFVVPVSNYSTGFDDGIKIDATDSVSFAIAAAVTGQLLTYYIALNKGLPIDKPRNLAKCVTVK